MVSFRLVSFRSVDDVVSCSISCHRMKSSADILTCRSMAASLLLRIFPYAHLSTKKMATKEKVGTDVVSLFGGDEFWSPSDSGSLLMSLVSSCNSLDAGKVIVAPLLDSWQGFVPWIGY